MMSTYQAISKANPHLIPKKTFERKGKNIAQVTLDGQDYLFKGSEGKLDREKLLVERRVLLKANEVEGITHLVDTYIRDNYTAILKEYAHGESLEKLDIYISDKGIQQKLIDTVNNLHSKGIVRLDLARRNIVLSPDKSNVTIIDLDDCKFSDSSQENYVQHCIKQDFRKLEECFI